MAACTICRRYTPLTVMSGAPRRAVEGACDQVECQACGVEQCFSNGGARGTCRVCHYGRLPGWSFDSVSRVCQYKGCSEAAVYAYLPGSKRHCCKTHGAAILARREEKRRL